MKARQIAGTKSPGSRSDRTCPNVRTRHHGTSRTEWGVSSLYSQACALPLFLLPVKCAKLVAGDPIRLYTEATTVGYVVKQVKVVRNDDRSVVAPGARERVTLISCTGTCLPLRHDYDRENRRGRGARYLTIAGTVLAYTSARAPMVRWPRAQSHLSVFRHVDRFLDGESLFDRSTVLGRLVPLGRSYSEALH